MFHVYDIAQNERAIVLRRGRAVRALAPGRHYVFGFGLSLERFFTLLAAFFFFFGAVVVALWAIHAAVNWFVAGVPYHCQT